MSFFNPAKHELVGAGGSMKRSSINRSIILISILILAAAALIVSGCSFETDGNFEGQIAGLTGARAPRPPANVHVLADTTGGIRISWQGSLEADGYTVYRALTSDTTHYARRGSSGKTEYIDSGASVPPETHFYYYVTAYNSKGESAPSAPTGPVWAIRNTTILLEPNIIATNVNGDDITVIWLASPGASGYILYRRSLYDGKVYVICIDTPSLSYTDINLAPGWYSYQVRGYNGDGMGYMSRPSDPVEIESSGTTLDVPEAPQNLSASRDTSSATPAINITWEAVLNADRYYVYRSLDDELYEEIGMTTFTSYKDEDGSGNELKSGAAYYYRVRGNNGVQPGYISDACGPVLLLPGKPAVSASVSGNTVTLNWTEMYGVDKYHVYRSNESNKSQFKLLSGSGISALSFTDSGLANGTWYYRIEASNKTGRGPSSEIVEAEVLVIADESVPVIINLGGMDEWDLVTQTVQVTANTNYNFSTGTTSYSSYEWYLDGALKGNSAVYTFNQNAGVYELAVVVSSSSGEKRSGRCRITAVKAGE